MDASGNLLRKEVIAMAKAKAEFKLKKETKGTYVYEELDEIQPKVGTIYVKKYTVGAPAPEKLTVTMEWK